MFHHYPVMMMPAAVPMDHQFHAMTPITTRAISAGSTPTRLDLLEHEVNRLAQQQTMDGQGGYPISQSMALMKPHAMNSSPMSDASTSASGGSVSMEEHTQVLKLYLDAVSHLRDLHDQHTSLMEHHAALMKMHTDVIQYTTELEGKVTGGAGGKPKKELKKHPGMGVIRLDYNYPAADGDTDSPASFGYDVTYRVVPGLTFEMAQAGKFTEQVERRFAEAIKFLEQKGVNGITGDCGFMMAFQVIARKIATVPVFMSSMVQCPIIAAAFDKNDKILILTANAKTLQPQKEVLLEHCGFQVEDRRFVIEGCQDLPGFDAVAKGEKVPIDIVQPAIVKMTMGILKREPKIAGILLECTELPPYADALRAATDLPVWDAITACDFYISGYKDNPRFGIDDWQAEWDKQQEEYSFGQNLIDTEKALLVNKIDAKKAVAKTKAKAKAAAKVKKLAEKQAPILGIVRLDYNYPPAAGDIDHPGSYNYDILFRCVPGLTFEMAQSGMMTYQVQREFADAIKWLESKGVAGITGDCGFMMAFQPFARDVATVPVFMSSMVQSPMISVAYDKYDKVLILTANSKTLLPQKNVLLSECGFDVDDDRFVIEGCQDVPGFDAVARGDRVDVEYVTPGIVKKVTTLLANQPQIRAILLECTELPPYSDALRKATGLPVWDAIT